jgi:hypothetical protein
LALKGVLVLGLDLDFFPFFLLRFVLGATAIPIPAACNGISVRLDDVVVVGIKPVTQTAAKHDSNRSKESMHFMFLLGYHCMNWKLEAHFFFDDDALARWLFAS